MKIRRLFSLSIIVLATVLVLTLGSGVASAADFCRTDPMIVLNNGMTLTVDVSIGTSVENVEKIDYKVYLPRGVTPESVVYYGNPSLVAKESVTFDVSRKSDEYTIETQVLTRGRAWVEVVSKIGFDPKWVPSKNGSHDGSWKWISKPVDQELLEGKNGQLLKTTLTAK